MDERLSRRILDQTTRVPDAPVSRQLGKVLDVDPAATDILTVTIRGTDRVNCLRLDSCSPREGDRVWVAQVGKEPPLVVGVVRDDCEIKLAPNTAGNWSASKDLIARVVAGRVFLDGQAGRSSGANNTICTLPTGYRPPYNMFCGVETLGARGAINVLTTGAVNYLAGTAAGMFLDGTSFRLP